MFVHILENNRNIAIPIHVLERQGTPIGLTSSLMIMHRLKDHLNIAVPVAIHLLEELGTPVHLPSLHGGIGGIRGLCWESRGGWRPQRPLHDDIIMSVSCMRVSLAA